MTLKINHQKTNISLKQLNKKTSNPVNATLKKILVLTLAAYASPALALEPFVIKDIRVDGVQRTEAGTVFNYLPVKVGDTMDDEKATQAIKSLYATGSFKDVRIEAEQNVLVVTVQERAAIAQINFSGNKSFPSDKMKDGLKQIGLADGMTFDKAMLERAEQEIKRQYLSQGKYGASVKATASPLERNRVAINFDIEEGSVSKIKKINIVGNQAFTNEALADYFKLSTPGWMTWWNKNDQYSKQKLSADLEALRSFYMNQGYLEFNIDSTQVSITPDKRDIYITVNITEGEKYNVSGIKVSGDTIIPEGDIRALISLKAGETFSRQKMTESNKAITDRLGNEGYAFANVNPIPEVDKENHTVAFTFNVDPGRKVYVRRVNITGNTRTRDEVIRREMRQMESSWYAGDKVARSKQRLDRTGYFSEVTVETPAVAGSPDQVDMNVNVTERSTGSISFGAGLSSAEGVVFSINVSQNNFLGTGNRVSTQINNGRVNKVYALSFTDPYFTPDGISRGFSIYKRDVDTSFLATGDYKTSSYGGGVSFGMPLNERDSVNAGLTFDYTQVILKPTSPDRFKFYCDVNRLISSCENTSLALNLGWIHDTRDNVLFPNQGVNQRISAEVGLPGFDLEYYKLDYRHAWYQPLGDDFTLMLNGELGYAASYGKRDYPFFKNFFIGGVNSVRGYETSSIGPRSIDAVTGANTALGGTRIALANAEIYFPVPGLSDSKQLRLSTFLDAGAVWGESSALSVSCDGAFDCLRYSTGLGVSWYSPFGPIKLVFAKALNAKDTDRTQTLQFQLGQQF